MRYFYSLNSKGKLINNRLNSVQDTGSTAAGMPVGRSFYSYDRDGRLARDMRGALNLRWTMDNKLRQAQNGSRFVRYWYDASGQRVMKRLHGDTAEYIVRDGTGNELLRTTRRNNSTASPVLVRTEANVYGASRIGVHELPMPTTPPQPDTMETRASSRYNYEITDHLGNVRVTVGDVKTFVVSSPGYRLDALVRSANDMYPYGMPMSTRTFAAPSFYRFGFNTQEKSIELNSGGNLTTALFWEYDSRIGRRWNLDPKPIVGGSTYLTFGNSPVNFGDPFGDTIRFSPEFSKNKYWMNKFNIWSKTKEGKKIFKEFDLGGKNEHVSIVFDIKNDVGESTQAVEVNKSKKTIEKLPFEKDIPNAGNLVAGTDKTSFLRFNLFFRPSPNDSPETAIDAIMHETQHLRIDLSTLKSNRMLASAYQQHTWMKDKKGSWFQERFSNFCQSIGLWYPSYLAELKGGRVKTEAEYVQKNINDFIK